MERQYVIENNKARQRLRALVNTISDEELTLQLYKEGWTVAAALGHIAFWDQRRVLLIERWKKTGVSPSPIDEEIINNALVPFLLEIPPRKVAEMTISIADKLDKELEKLPPDLISETEKSGDRHALDRGIHRNMHLADIETLLKTKRTNC
jgi:uncharacterized damage-inducible protein DinB